MGVATFGPCSCGGNFSSPYDTYSKRRGAEGEGRERKKGQWGRGEAEDVGTEEMNRRKKERNGTERERGGQEWELGTKKRRAEKAP